MLGKILGAVAGSQVAQHVRGIDGTGGAVLGVAATSVLRRLGPVGLAAAAVGGYALKKHMEKREARKAPVAPKAAPGKS